jgi:integrase/G:T/U-mismatch repair DNA glycosylase
MSWPRLTIDTVRDITIRKVASGHFEARTRYCDWDGKTGQVQSSGATAAAAERALKARLVERSQLQSADTTLTPDSLFSDLVAYWLADIDMEGRISRTTRNLYERNMRTLVSPGFDSLTLREIGVARCDRFIKELGKRSHNRAKQARVVLRPALELAVRHEVLQRNPMDHVSRLRREPHIPDALTAPEVNAIRAAIARWESGADHVSGPLPDGQLGAIVEVMLGTSARIGEVLAIRRRDVDITSAVPSIRLAGTIVSRNGEQTFRQDHPKTAKSRRIVAPPTFASDAVRRRLANAGRLELDSLLFQSRDGTPLTTANVRRQLRRVLGGVGIDGVTPHMFRRTVATAVNDNASVELERIIWMGNEVLTLAEIWPANSRAVIVGINPSQTSVDAGHYFQGQGARGQVIKLVGAGLMAPNPGERQFERAALDAGVGFADLVRRPTHSAKDVPNTERTYGRELFVRSMAERNVPLVIGIYEPPIAALMQSETKPGYQDAMTSWGARVFRMPGPMHERDEAAAIMATLGLD